MKSFVCVLVFFLHVWTVHGIWGGEKTYPEYEYTYNRHAGGWLKLNLAAATFNEAFFRCDSEGAILASPSNEGLLQALKLMYPKKGSLCGMYVGIHSTLSHGHYTTIEGVPLEQTPVDWARGESQYHTAEKCVIMVGDGTLASVACNGTYPYVCYKKKAKTVRGACGTSDPGYSLDSRTGQCYKFHRNGLTWRRAHATCVTEGGHLAIINSGLEADVVNDVFNQNLPDTIVSNGDKHQAAIGIVDWGGTGQWYTVHGQKLQDIGYSKWLDNKPSGPGDYCGSVVRNMKVFNDVPCENYDLGFICEKDPRTPALDEVF